MAAPIVSPSTALLSKHSPTKDLYSKLHNDSSKNRLVFRVHDSLSSCKIDWTGNPATSGFSSLDPALSKLPPDERKSMVDHVLGRGTFPAPSPSSMGSSSLPASSPWISTTRNVDLAIWEIARRLAIGHVPLVRLAIIRQAFLTPEKDRLKISTGDEVRVNPARVLRAWENGSDEIYERQDLMAAGKRAEESHETLFHGRVFSRSIEADLMWTAEALPFELPSRFWEMNGEGKAYLPGWLGRLRWDPLLDGWEVSREKMKRRIRGMGKAWDSQPVHDWAHHWPPTKSGRSHSNLLSQRRAQVPQDAAITPTQESYATKLKEVDVVADMIARAESMALVSRERTMWQVSAYDSDEQGEDQKGDEERCGEIGEEGPDDPFGLEV